MRIFSLAAVSALAGCGQTPQAEQPIGERIDCALDGATKFAPICVVEDGGYQEGLTVIVIHHPDGKFRRFLQPGDGTLKTADGVEQVLPLTPHAEDVYEASIGEDRYRMVSKTVVD
jgi:hypothetical protein